MNMLMGLSHRQQILDSIPVDGWYLEWGAGGSTVWLSKHLPMHARMVSIESDRRWGNRVIPLLTHRCTVHIRAPVVRPTRAPGRATEEDPTGLAEYFAAVPGPFNVILVNGLARSHCLERAKELLAPDGLVFLHDAERDWYDQALAGYDQAGRLPSCHDYPGPELWWGRPASSAREIHS